jgi:hypothetical protein
MARPGRKRRVGVPRNANGEILTSAKNAERAARNGDKDWRVREVAQFQRAKMIVEALIKDPRLTSPIGKMLLLGAPRAITAQLYAAGDHALKIMNTYDRVVLGVCRDPSSVPLEGAGGRSVAAEVDQSVVSSATQSLMRLERALGRVILPGAASAFKSLVRGAEPTKDQADLAVMCLKEVCVEFGFDIPSSEAAKAAKGYKFIGEEKLLEPVNFGR